MQLKLMLNTINNNIMKKIITLILIIYSSYSYSQRHFSNNGVPPIGIIGSTGLTGSTGSTGAIGITGSTGGVAVHLANSAPTVNDDNTQGYVQGQTWYNLNNGLYYVAFNVITGAATWVGLATIGSTGTTGAGIVETGISKLITGFDTIKTINIASGSKVFLTGSEGSTGIMRILFEKKSERSSGVYFTVYSSNAIDTSHYSWMITQ